MKPVRLTLQAFGPFADEQIVDFERLPPGALVLIHGPTGAGKTSLLDGICFALYGETSGKERGATQMRSDHAPDDRPTSVTFEFELRGQRLRVTRTPSQELAAKTKDGTVKKQTQARLHRLDGATWTLLASKPRDVDRALEERIGFDVAQFRHVIMLPQGQFRKVLTADSNEREAILEVLFETLRCKQVQDGLTEAAKRLKADIEGTWRTREVMLATRGAATVEALGERITANEALVALIEAQVATARTTADASAKALAAGQAAHVKLDELATARQALTSLDAREGGMALVREELAAARRAQEVAPAHQGLEDARTRLRDAQNHVATLATGLPAIEAAAEGAQQRLITEQARTPEREGLRQRLGELEALQPQLAGWHRAVADVEAARTAHSEVTTRAEEAAKAAEAMQAEVTRLADACAARRPLAAALEALQLKLKNHRQWLDQQAGLKKAQKAAAKAADEASRVEALLHAAQATLTAARTHHADLTTRVHASQAALLASHLVDGEPCPVCGSADHPTPARPGDETPSEDEVTAAEAKMAEAATAVEVAQASHVTAQTRHAELASKAATLLEAIPAEAPNDPDELAARVTALAGEAKVAEEAATFLATEGPKLDALTEATKAATAAAATHREAAAAQLLEREKAEAVMTERARGIPEERRAEGALESAIAQTKADAARLEQALKDAEAAVAEATQALVVAHAQHAQATTAMGDLDQALIAAVERFAAACAAAAFPDEAAFKAAVRTPATIAQLDGQHKEHASLLAAAKDRVARAEQAADGLAPPDVAQLAQADQAARAALEEVLGALGDAKRGLEDDRQVAAQLAELATRHGDLEARYAVVGRMAEVAGGENGLRLTFQRYVLAAMLDDVLRQASLRLQVMSRRRYSLIRRGTVADRRKHAGLDLDVYDEFTGKARPAETLSGGEGFMAALALALGLSDTVQAYAGGIQLDTLFIDEGFGSLDAEALDEALRVLVDLQRGGRMVGIISHVEELKRQIDTTIVVSRGDRGSTVHMGSRQTAAGPKFPHG